MKPWDLNETYRYVQNIFGHEQKRLARESARSVTDRQAFSSYHFEETIRLSEEFERAHMIDVSTILQLRARGAEESEREFQVFMVKAGAHSVAAVQSLHAIPDIFAHALYFSSGQNLGPRALEESHVSLPNVAKCLQYDPNFAKLSLQLRSIQTGSGWSHLAALSNNSKHRSVVRASYSEDWFGIGPRVRGLQVSSFRHKGKDYPAIGLRDLLEPEYERIMRLIVHIGNELNSCLRAVAASTYGRPS